MKVDIFWHTTNSHTHGHGYSFTKWVRWALNNINKSQWPILSFYDRAVKTLMEPDSTKMKPEEQ